MLLAGFLGTQATLLACVTLLAMIDLMFGGLRAGMAGRWLASFITRSSGTAPTPGFEYHILDMI